MLIKTRHQVKKCRTTRDGQQRIYVQFGRQASPDQRSSISGRAGANVQERQQQYRLRLTARPFHPGEW